MEHLLLGPFMHSGMSKVRNKFYLVELGIPCIFHAEVSNRGPKYNCDFLFFFRLTKHTYLVHFCGDIAFYRRNMLHVISTFWKNFLWQPGPCIHTDIQGRKKWHFFSECNMQKFTFHFNFISNFQRIQDSIQDLTTFDYFVSIQIPWKQYALHWTCLEEFSLHVCITHMHAFTQGSANSFLDRWFWSW